MGAQRIARQTVGPERMCIRCVSQPHGAAGKGAQVQNGGLPGEAQ